MGGYLMRIKKNVAIILTLIMIMGVLGGCADNSGGTESKGTVQLGVVNWAEGISMTNLAAAILEDHIGYEVDITVADVAPIFTSVASGNTDAFLDVWLPLTHESYMEEYGDDIIDLGVINGNARIGLVVPEYVEVDTIEELRDNPEMFNGEIIGIDAGAGIMSATERAIEEYNMDLNLIMSSEAAMTAALSKAIADNEPVVVTGWTPHWKFADFDLKFLEDSLGVYGETEEIHAIVRKGLEEDMPEVYSLLENFALDDDQLGSLMGAVAAGDDDLEAARAWMNENEDVITPWIE